MSSSVTTHTNGVVVITHVHPIGNAGEFTGGTSPPHGLGQVVSSVLDTFRRRNPKAVGTVQIMIGLVTLMLGIVMASSVPGGFGVYSVIYFWGSVVYVIAGSLTVAADNHLNKCLVIGSLVLNIIAMFFSMAAIILHPFLTVLLMFYCLHPYNSYCQQDSISGISGVLAVLSLLEFIVSIYVSVIASLAVCQCCQSDQEQVFLVGNQLPVPDSGIMNPENTAFPLLNRHQDVNCPGEPLGGAMGTGFQQNIPSPQYTAVPS